MRNQPPISERGSVQAPRPGPRAYAVRRAFAAGRPRVRLGLALALATVAGFGVSASTAAAASYQVPAAIADDCSVDVTTPLLAWIAAEPDGSTLSFGSGKCYRVEGTLEFSGRNNLDFEGNGSRFESFDPPADQRATWRAWDSTGLRFNDMTVQGSYANAGTFDSSIQHAHAFDFRGTNAQVTDVTMLNVGGDCVYFGLGATVPLTRSSGGVLDSSCLGTGRNAVSVTAGNNILVQHLTTSAIGYDVFDVEPNSGSGWGSQSVTFDSNTIGSYYGSAYSIVENAPISAQAFTNNRVIGRGLKITVGQRLSPSYPASGVTITGNSSDASQAPSAMNLSAITGLTVMSNTVPLTGGTMQSTHPARSACPATVILAASRSHTSHLIGARPPNTVPRQPALPWAEPRAAVIARSFGATTRARIAITRSARDDITLAGTHADE